MKGIILAGGLGTHIDSDVPQIDRFLIWYLAEAGNSISHAFLPPDPASPGGQTNGGAECLEFLNMGVPPDTLNLLMGVCKRFEIPSSDAKHPRSATSARKTHDDDATTTANSSPVLRCNGGSHRRPSDPRHTWPGCQAERSAVQVPLNGTLLVSPAAGRTVC